MARTLALSDPKVRAEYEAFKLEFAIAEQCKSLQQKMNIRQEAVAEKCILQKVQFLD